MPRPRAFSTLFPYTTLFRSFVKIFAVLVEDLNAMIGAIVHENTPGLGINRDAVNVVHVSRSRIVRGVAFLSPVEKELAVLVELCDPCSVITIRYKHRAVGNPGQKRRTI